MHRLVLFAETEAGVVYSEKLYGFCIPAFSEVGGNEMEDTVVSAAVQGKAKPDGHWGQCGQVNVVRVATCASDTSRDPQTRRTRSFMECLFRQLRQGALIQGSWVECDGRLLARYYHWLLATNPLVRRFREPTKKESIGNGKLDGAMDERALTMHMLFPFRSVCASFVDLRPLGVISLRAS